MHQRETATMSAQSYTVSKDWNKESNTTGITSKHLMSRSMNSMKESIMET